MCLRPKSGRIHIYLFSGAKRKVTALGYAAGHGELAAAEVLRLSASKEMMSNYFVD